ncbi:thiol peroxidase [Pseudoalteromonas sp. G4]|uniref:thiol peroxidase n=1 Tax=Pseudoalteromonas sp. G4 TaxID=2992761 RepID=UPI00237D9F94|nr:thiol peroxidase [Pseudoalteromonas sp. G4]MDE3272382.1 thiol peroxidase [Pseudoalteromonas sp. G4]
MLKKMFTLTGLLTASVFALNVSAEQYQLPVNQVDSGKVSANNNKLTLRGKPVELGQPAPNFKAANNKFSPVSLSDFAGKAVLISTVPSLDTGICSLQTKHFNDKIANNYSDVVMLTISMDLPFAQSRFCKTENITQLHTLSDAVWREFAQNYGLLIEDMGLLARSVIILDKEHNVVYKQLVTNLAKEPDYISVEAALKKL